MTIDQEATEFATLLFTHAKGRAHDKATAQLREAVEAVKRTGKSGYVAVKFAIDPVKDNYEVVRIQSHVTSRFPRKPRPRCGTPTTTARCTATTPTSAASGTTSPPTVNPLPLAKTTAKTPLREGL